MSPRSDPILTVAQTRAAEDALIAAGTDVDTLMQRAGRGAAGWVWRLSAGGPVTVLCGPGNNGGDGFVLAQAIYERGGAVSVVAPLEPKTDAARRALALYRGSVVETCRGQTGSVFVDCLFGSGLSRALSSDLATALRDLSGAHRLAIAVDIASGVEADSGRPLNDGLPRYDLTLALGTLKFAHLLMPSVATAGAVRVVPIGIEAPEGSAFLIDRPRLAPPGTATHKYARGLCAVVGGAMPGAALLAARAAQGGGAGYVKLVNECAQGVPNDLVRVSGPLSDALADPRIASVLVGPGLGRDKTSRSMVTDCLQSDAALVLDADALMLLQADDTATRCAPTIATPHAGELAKLEAAFSLEPTGSKADRARALSAASGMIVVAKGPDTVVAAPDGRLACTRPATSWLSTAGTGDVLAGTIASRLATGVEPFDAACQGVWLHGEAARLCGPALTAGDLASAIPAALGACL